jgi:hypothetical protein
MFDGVLWDSPNDGSALAAYPGAPLSADALTCALVSGHYAARHNGRLFGMQTYPRLQRGTNEGAAGLWIDSTSFQQIGGARGWIDGTWTHATAYVLADVVASVDVPVFLRVVADDGTTTETGGTVQRDVSPNVTITGPRSRVFYPDLSDNAGEIAMYAEVSLAALTLSQRCRIRVQAYAAGTLLAGYYRPREVSIYLECRD